jgi:methyl-accepting chemotaxis protein
MNSFSWLPIYVKTRVAMCMVAGAAILGLLASTGHLAGAVLPLVQVLLLMGGALIFLIADGGARRMKRSAEDLAKKISAIAEGEFQAVGTNAATGEELQEIAEAIEALRASVGGMAAAVVEGSSALKHDGDELARAGAEAWNRTARQSERISQMAATSQEMSSSIAEVSHHAVTAADQAREAAQAAREGGTTVDAMHASMEAISQSVRQSSETLDRLGKQSEQIIRIVNVIEEIAEKTNLLALNAAIEAARAGEQGRGFAVVAGEVRRLAESTRGATTEIGQIIDGITSQTREAIETMRSGTERVTQGMEVAARTGGSLKRIIAAANEVESTIAQIATAATEQSAAAEEFSHNIDALNRLGEEHAAASPVTKGWVESVRSDAQRLEQSIQQFGIHMQSCNDKDRALLAA